MEDIKLPLLIALMAIGIATCTYHFSIVADDAVDDWARVVIDRR